MSSSHVDRNLLFGILALQMDFISRDALISAMHAWVLNKQKPLGQILVEQGALAPDALGNRFINLEMVRDGFAWRYVRYDKAGRIHRR
jgi:hypothetical protein